MGSIGGEEMRRPHAVCIPYPAQGHITPMLKLAKLLHAHGFHITFVNTHFNHKRLLRSQAISSPDAVPATFRFDSIPDGLPPSDEDATQDIPSLCDSLPRTCLPHFLDLLRRLDADPSSPPVSCIVSDGIMSFTLDAAKKLGLPEVLFWTTSACGFMAYLHYPHLIERGLVPLRDEGEITNGFLERAVDWVPGMKNMRLKDFPSFIRTTDPEDVILNFVNREVQRAAMAAGVILNTFDELEQPVLDAMASMFPRIYTVGPLPLLSRRAAAAALPSVQSNLWKEERGCLEWLEGRRPGSVVYVNFGSITVMTNEQLVEFAWGLANCGYEFLWVVRRDLVKGDAAVLPPEFLEETKGRGLLASWCPQEAVLAHAAVGGFLTHSGWNSTVESICGGVAMVSWPFFAEQQTNCRYACTEWGIGMEIDSNVRREEVAAQIRELMGDGPKGTEMRRKAVEWREKAVKATQPGGSSTSNLERLVDDLLHWSSRTKN